MEVVEELETLHNTVSLTLPVSKALVIDLLFSIPEESPIPKPLTGIFLVTGLSRITEGRKAQKIPILSRPRSRTAVGFDCDDNVHPAFTFGQI